MLDEQSQKPMLTGTDADALRQAAIEASELAEQLRQEPKDAGAAETTLGKISTGLAPQQDAIPELDGYDIDGGSRKGSMGQVWSATRHRDAKQVAIKRAKPGYGRRFVGEMSAMGNLTHPNIVALLDIARDEHGQLAVMEFIDGKPMSDCGGKFPADKRTVDQVFLPLARALKHAHERQITHRDISYNNVMLRADGSPAILDFGLARHDTGETSRLTETGDGPMGTLAFMPPEQIRDSKHVTPNVDVYALGVLCQWMIDGRLPFEPSAKDNAQRRPSLKKTPTWASWPARPASWCWTPIRRKPSCGCRTTSRPRL